MNQQIYHMHDSVLPRGMSRCSLADAPMWNQKGHGIFITVNDFNGPRTKENLKKINCWVIDLDSGTKDEMAEKIRSGLTPSLVVETKQGFHCWWVARDADPHYWNAIVLDRLVPFYGADKNARDLCRVLRMPGFFHLKDPSDPFLIKKVYEHRVSYSQSQLVSFYPDLSKPERKEFITRNKKELGQTDDFWENVWRMDCIDALEKLSGTKHVNHEEFSFRKNSNGKFNILVNGKGTSSFIDRDFRIGSLSDGGPTIAQWLKWYGHSWRDVVSIIKEFFPEVEYGTKKI